jgi:hypothetical protein
MEEYYGSKAGIQTEEERAIALETGDSAALSVLQAIDLKDDLAQKWVAFSIKSPRLITE